MSDCTLGKLGEQWHRERERVGDRACSESDGLIKLGEQKLGGRPQRGRSV